MSGWPRSLQAAIVRIVHALAVRLVRLAPQSPSRYSPERFGWRRAQGPVGPAVSKPL